MVGGKSTKRLGDTEWHNSVPPNKKRQNSPKAILPNMIQKPRWF